MQETRLDEAKLESMGWSLVRGPGPGKMLSLSTQIPHWGTMSWAERIYHQARYGFDRQGTLFMFDRGLRNREVESALLSAARHERQGRAYVIPGGTIPGSDERLRKLLQDHLVRELMKARENSIVWIGHDDSILLTCPEGWGVPGHVETSPLYCEFSQPEQICCWEGYGEQPAWSTELLEKMGEEPDRPPGLQGHWKLEDDRNMWGVRQRIYRDQSHIMGSSIIVTDDGQHRLHWNRKHTKTTLTETADPKHGENWTVTIRSRGIPNMINVTSRRDGKTKRLGSVEDLDVAYAAVHNHVARFFNRPGEAEEDR